MIAIRSYNNGLRSIRIKSHKHYLWLLTMLLGVFIFAIPHLSLHYQLFASICPEELSTGFFLLGTTLINVGLIFLSKATTYKNVRLIQLRRGRLQKVSDFYSDATFSLRVRFNTAILGRPAIGESVSAFLRVYYIINNGSVLIHDNFTLLGGGVFVTMGSEITIHLVTVRYDSQARVRDIYFYIPTKLPLKEAKVKNFSIKKAAKNRGIEEICCAEILEGTVLERIKIEIDICGKKVSPTSIEIPLKCLLEIDALKVTPDIISNIENDFDRYVNST